MKEFDTEKQKIKDEKYLDDLDKRITQYNRKNGWWLS